MKILLIEDEKKVSAFIKRGLENERYTVEAAFDGGIGLEMSYDKSFDVIILDLMLPVIDGFTILKRLRESGIQTPVLILSSKGEIDDRIHGFVNVLQDLLHVECSRDLLSQCCRQVNFSGACPDHDLKLSAPCDLHSMTKQAKTGHQGHRRENQERRKPPSLCEGGLKVDINGRHPIASQSPTDRGGDLKTMVTGWQVRKEGDPP